MKRSALLGIAKRFCAALLVVAVCQSTGRGQQTGDNVLDEHSGANWARKPITKLYDGKEHSDTLPTPGKLLPHAGEYVSNEKNYYEIVYMPLQTRIYAYNSTFEPMSAGELRAQMTIRPASGAAGRPIRFQYVPQPPGATEQDYVAANFDIRPLQEREVSISFELAYKSSAPTTMTPYYARFSFRPYISKAAVSPGDQAAIARQAYCPVTGAPLGSRGPIVKLYVAEFPLYLSGEDCIAAVQQAPQRFVPQAPPPPRQTAASQ
jgi:hypothetical protein